MAAHRPGPWLQWGPTVRAAELHDEKFEQGATRTVTTQFGVKIRVEITDYVDGACAACEIALRRIETLALDEALDRLV